MPFILANPHHSMAWARTFPGSLEAKQGELRAEIARFETAISGMDAKREESELTSKEREEYDRLVRGYRSLVSELLSLSEGPQGIR